MASPLLPKLLPKSIEALRPSPLPAPLFQRDRLQARQSLAHRLFNGVHQAPGPSLFAGSFAGAILPDENGESPYDLVLSPGDLDESVGALLTFRSAADRERQGPGFERARAFRTGVLQGPDACTDL